MKFAFGTFLLAAVLAATPAMADPVADPDPAPARSSTAMSGGRFHPYNLWGGIGYYNTSAPSYGTGQFGISAGSSYAVPINPDLSWLVFGNIAVAFGDVTSFPVTVGGGVRGEHVGPVQLAGLAGFTVAPISQGTGTKIGLALGAQAFLPLPQVMPNLGVQTQFLFHILTDSVDIWTINAGFYYILPY
ncbi:MAG TPA: hypothetical protein VG496_06180 [Myxococcales bacterium]|nr:hypothetical protein [Myxococcales bacterium]